MTFRIGLSFWCFRSLPPAFVENYRGIKGLNWKASSSLTCGGARNIPRNSLVWQAFLDITTLFGLFKCINKEFFELVIIALRIMSP